MKNQSIENLHQAAKAIVRAARMAMKDSGDENPEQRQLYMPILIQGTDLRVVIESGPLTMSANALQTANMQAGGLPRMSYEDAVRRAADLLTHDAICLKEGHTNPADRDDWGQDGWVKERHDEMLEVVDALQRGR